MNLIFILSKGVIKVGRKPKNIVETTIEIRPALTPEGRENQMIALAINCAEKQLLEGTASSQVITHYLKLGSTKNQLEMERLRNENELLKAKTKALESAEHLEELFSEAIAAMKEYRGEGDDGKN